MNWKRYQNELMVLGAFLFMFSMYLYKQNARASQSGANNSVSQTIVEIKEVVSLKKVWVAPHPRSTAREGFSLKYGCAKPLTYGQV